MEKEKNSFSFHGEGGELFIIFLVNALLTVITLGIYRFWAKVKVLKFLYRHTEFMGERFDYHGTGKERFIGFLKALGIFVVFILGIIAIYQGLALMLPPDIAQIISIIIVYVVIIAFIPFILVGSERYRLSRSSWRNIRFKFSGTSKEFYPMFLKGILMNIITLGIYSPWFRCKIYKYFADHSQYGNQPFNFTGAGMELFKIYLKGILLSFITLGIYSFWLASNLVNFYWNNVTFQNNKFSSSITGGMIFKTTLKSILLVVFSMGIGLPWAYIWNMKLQIGTISYNGNIDLKLIQADLDKKASSLADGIADAAGALDLMT